MKKFNIEMILSQIYLKNQCSKNGPHRQNIWDRVKFFSQLQFPQDISLNLHYLNCGFS